MTYYWILEFCYILSKNKKYPGYIFHAWVNRSENTLLPDACLETLTILLCRRAVHFGFLCKWWNKWRFKHKKGRFLFHRLKPWKLLNLNAHKIGLYGLSSQIVSPRSKKRHKWNNIYKHIAQQSLLVCVLWLQRKCEILTFTVQTQFAMECP